MGGDGGSSEAGGEVWAARALGLSGAERLRVFKNAGNSATETVGEGPAAGRVDCGGAEGGRECG